MNQTDLPESITVYEGENEYLDGDLDYAYVDALAADMADLLQTSVAECCYQPGDGTRYPLVIVPLFMLRHGRPRVVEGTEWERHAVSGISHPDIDVKNYRQAQTRVGADYYHPNGYLISWVEHACYPLRLGDRGILTGDYVGDHWGTSISSGVALAILFRAISHHLDRWAAMPVEPRRSLA